jgi:hypothetical protein
LVSSNGRDYTRRVSDLAAAVAKLTGRTLVLDGEVAIYDKQLRSRFEWLRERDTDTAASAPLFMVFDRSITRLPCSDQAAATYCRAWRMSSPAANCHFAVAAARARWSGGVELAGRLPVRGLRRQRRREQYLRGMSFAPGSRHGGR